MKEPSLDAAAYTPERRDLERLEPELRALWNEALSAYPELSSVEIVVPEASEALGFTGGEFLLPDEEYENPAVVIVPGDDAMFEALKSKRPLAAAMVAEALGKDVARLTGAELKTFIFLHELGHAQDYLKHFAGDPQIGPETAAQAWRDRSARELDSLPVPGLDPNDLNLELQGEEMDASKQRRLDAQERAYRNLPKEAYADRFAAEFLKGRHEA